MLRRKGSVIKSVESVLVGTFCRRFGIRLRYCMYMYKQSKSFASANYQSKLTESLRRIVRVLLELLFVTFCYFCLSCVSQAAIARVVDFICTSWWLRYFMCLFFCIVTCTLCTICIIDNNTLLSPSGNDGHSLRELDGVYSQSVSLQFVVSQ